MQFTFNIYLVIFSIGAVQALVLSLLILLKRPLKRQSCYIGLLLLVFSLGSFKIIFQEVLPGFLDNLRFPLAYQFASGPLLYLFVKNLLRKEWQPLRKVVPHFIPLLFIDVAYRSGFHWFGFRNSDSLIQIINFSTNIAATISYIVYTLLALRVWYRYNDNIKTKKTAATQRALFWTKALILVDAVSTVATIAYIILTIYYDGFALGTIKTYYIPYVALTLYTYFLCYMCYQLPEIEILSPALKEQSTGDLKQVHDKTIALIQQALERDRFYTDPDINLQKLSSTLQIPARDLSAAINQGLGKNFNDFINSYRIAYFKEMLIREENTLYSIEGLAYEAGFNSKASFYRTFKKETGQTPHQFQKEREKNAVKQVSDSSLETLHS